jgi:hypothetical protein
MNTETINDKNICFEANWARTGFTTSYNPATLILEEWLSSNNTKKLAPNSFGNLSSANGDDACFDMSCGSNEQGDQQCSDGIDNDNDGLVDCLDPGCGSALICRDNCNALAPTITGN